MSSMTMQTLFDAIKMVERAPAPQNSRVFVDDNVCVQRERIQIRFPRRKCHRLRKRFAKYAKNWQMRAKEVFYQTPFGYIVSSRCAAALSAADGGEE
ncbi:MAG: hypothetical protein WCT23_09545 [Candidatus Neomarinimicrobiota bacterium]